MDQIVIKGWRRLAVRCWGPRRGTPVFLLHGTPGCRLSVRPRDVVLEQVNVRLITYDRPGYGLSDPHPGRTVADAADDVRTIADTFRLETFAVMGRSGGAPHALACAALLHRRVSRVASLVGLAPYDAAGLDWMDGMVEINRQQYGAAAQGPKPLSEVIYPQVVAMRADPAHLARRLEREGVPSDQFFAFTHPLGFDPAWIRVPTLIWHATRDVFSPITHARWLAGRIPHAVLHVCDNASHLSAAGAQESVLHWLVNGDDSRLTLPSLSA
jgi:pimeloyl-ACP methyl ester carboxylesterase